MKCKIITERVNAGLPLLNKSVRDEHGAILWACNYDPHSERSVLTTRDYLERWLAAYPDIEIVALERNEHCK